MNLILLSDSDFITPHRVRLSDRRLVHIQDILKAECGKTLTVGKINGLMGQGIVVSKETEQNLSFPRKRESSYIELEIKLNKKPPEPLPLTLILALPRPPMLKRILFSAAMLGVKKIIILNFNRVEKSLWNSSSLKPQAITEQLVLGLEQARDTVMPEVILKKGFKPFVEDELPALIKGPQTGHSVGLTDTRSSSQLLRKLALVAHPGGDFVIPAQGRIDRHSQLLAGIHNKNILLIIGPEGGIVDYEIDLLKAVGCHTIDLGPRILRTEYVLPYVVGRLFSLSFRRKPESRHEQPFN